ncbi:MAG: hypothetical protein H7Z13_09195 [Ferruginibacter sp.]|nr:hypothetical protein [Ferruginibacter sp.]
MKTFLWIAIFFGLVLAGCDNNKGGGTNKSIAKDSAVAFFTDLTSVTDIKKLLCQSWENKEDAEDAALSGGGEGLEIPYRGFSFFEDASVVESPRDKIRFGKWTLNEADKIIDLEFSKGGKAQYKIETIGPKQMILMNTADKKKIEYRADGKMYKNMADDPFYGSNNQWRIKPATAESDSGIKLRTEQCVLFYAKLMEDNGNRGSYSFVGLPTCFKWYRGGFTINSKDKLEDKWVNCYYSKDQAYKAHALLESIISKKYKWNKEEKNWLKQSAEVVRQMYDTLRLL